MTHSRPHIDLAMARVVHSTGDLVEVRIGPLVRIDPAGTREALQACRTFLGARKGPILFVVEGDPAWDPALLQVDHFTEFGETIEAVGVVVTNKVLALAANTYFSLFPPDFPIRIDHDENAVRARLAAT